MKIKMIILTLLIIMTGLACSKKSEIEKPALKRNDALIIGNPLSCGIENMLIFPVGSNYKPVVYESPEKAEEYKGILSNKITLSFSTNLAGATYDRSAEVEYLNSDEDKFDIRNILFYDLKTGLTYPLVLDTLHILSFAIHKEFGESLIFYRVVKNDHNQDSVYNSKDPVMLYISDLYGRNFTQITPENEQFVDYTYYPKTHSILIKTIIDSDHDKHFTNFDETNFRDMKITEPSMSREIFEKSLKDTLRKQLKAN